MPERTRYNLDPSPWDDDNYENIPLKVRRDKKDLDPERKRRRPRKLAFLGPILIALLVAALLLGIVLAVKALVSGLGRNIQQRVAPVQEL